MEITEDEAEEELQAKADSLTRADEIRAFNAFNAFNAFHGYWVYEIESRFADKLKLTKSDLTERAN